MGYRSQVAIAIGKENELDFLKSLKSDDLDKAIVHDFDDRIVYEFEWINWSTNFDSVVRIMASLDSLGLEHMDYEFMRVGENEGDFHHDNSGDHEDRWLVIRQEIHICDY